MLTELRIRDLGVIADLALVFKPRMTALTGETGAGKTMIVEAMDLLVGGRADPVLVRPGAAEAWVEGRFVLGDDEIVLARAIPASGRSRAYVDGRMAPISALAEVGARLVDLHGQHNHQSLMSASAQRGALDAFARVDHRAAEGAQARLREIEEALVALGGDSRGRAREIDLLRYEIAELDAAAIVDEVEDAGLEADEDVLSDAVAHREAAEVAHAALAGEGGATDTLGAAVAAVAGRAPFPELERRLRSIASEASDLASDVRAAGEALQEDPERLATVRARRQLLRELQRKYGASLAEVMVYGATAQARLVELDSFEERIGELEADRATTEAELAAARLLIGNQRRSAAKSLADEIGRHLAQLAMPRARFEVEVSGDPAGDTVTFRIGANAGEPCLPLAKVASGGELARTMLAARLVLAGGAPTLVFDEVDAGVGGEAARAVGRSLAALAREHQVLVVTHLPQVAAFADHQVGVDKREEGGRTVAGAAALDDPARVVELSRMLSGQPGSVTARDHAEELLATAARERGR